ncbi:MAG: type 4a pilus biogenesis protein PilO [Gemmatimonadaceae bacterium]|nr:type 4a pilus biogenesis protein PilO [Gemmatimonadaceae bacterium]
MAMATKDRNFLVLGVLSVLLAGAYVYQFWLPQRTVLAEQQAHVDSLLVINQRAKAELAQGRTRQLREEADRYAEDLAVMRQLVPTGNEVPALLEQVSTAARSVGLDISDVQPLPQLVGDTYDSYKYRMSVRGGYHQIGRMLTTIGSLQRIVAPINLSLAPTSADPRKSKNGRIQQIEARFEIQTYVARTAFVPPSRAKPAAEPASKPGER